MEENKKMNRSNENMRIRIVEVDPKETVEEGLPRFTRTGKISYAKTRVYTQRYRKEWENMSDFRDWLTSVPDQNTKAYCKFCERTLHAHRLSLLKHMCTLKHQRAAAHIQREQLNESNISNTSIEVDELIEENDEYEEECSYIVEDEEIITGNAVEPTEQESENQEESPPTKKVKAEKENKPDSLEEAMAHVNADYLSENESEVNSQNESSNQGQEKVVYIKQDVQSDDENIEEDTEKTDDSRISLSTSKCDTKPVNSNVDNSKKMIILTTNGKPITILKSSNIMLNKSNKDNYTVTKVMSDSKVKFAHQSLPTTAISKISIPNNVINSVTNMSTLLKQKTNTISTYVLDTSKGCPVSGMQVSLYKLQDGRWTFIEESMTNANGVCDDFAVRKNLSSGRYKLHYDVEKYYNVRKISTIYPFIEIVFDVKNPNLSYHTPLYLSPFSYSTFKDTSK